MLRITIELVPYGQEEYKSNLFQMIIGNVGTHCDGLMGDYVVKTPKDQFYLNEFDRRNGCVDLLYKVLKKMGKKNRIQYAPGNSINYGKPE